MSHCINPNCNNPFNPDHHKFCQTCGSSLVLRNRYRAIKPLGDGGFGKTYQAEDLDCLNAVCVIKQFLPSADIQANPQILQKATELFNQEAERLFHLGEHSQIPRLLAYFEQDKRLYLVQELIDGQTLLQELQTEGVFSETKIREILLDLLPVLQVIHGEGVIHRDIKPDNIMRRRKDGKLILIDFGVSKQVTGTIFNQQGTSVGTPGYIPLEQLRGTAYPASDLYSLGVTCVILLTGCLPKGDGSSDLYNPIEGSWIWKERLPAEININPILEQILNKMLAERVKDRYQSALEVSQDLQDNLSSAVGVDYRKLRDLLAVGNWKEADAETVHLMLLASGRKKEGWIDQNSIKNFPCLDLATIDRLWLKYSNGHFGFTVQKKIWQSLGGNANSDVSVYKEFCDRIGWHEKGELLYYSNLTFDLNVPPGHLPSGRAGDISLLVRLVGKLGGFGVERVSLLVSRLESCGI